MIKHGLQIFACNASRDLAGDIAQRLGLRLGQLEISRFSNDNLRVQIRRTCASATTSWCSRSPSR